MKYKVPFISKEAKELIQQLVVQHGGIIEAEYSLTERNYILLEIASDKLNKALREQLGLDRVSVSNAIQHKQDFIQNNIPLATIEPDPKKVNSILITFPACLQHREIIKKSLTISKENATKFTVLQNNEDTTTIMDSFGIEYSMLFGKRVGHHYAFFGHWICYHALRL